MKIAVIFDNFGPYHIARLRAAAGVCELLAIEVAASSAEYAWKSVKANAETLKPESLKGGTDVSISESQYFSFSAFKMVTLLSAGTSRSVPTKDLRARLNSSLDDFKPKVVFIPGWSGRAAFAALKWSGEHGVPAVCMSESTAWDSPRGVWSEELKRQIVELFSAALVGGRPHKEYMVRLGMPPEHVSLGYDAVDNAYFAQGAKTQKQKLEIGNQKSEEAGNSKIEILNVESKHEEWQNRKQKAENKSEFQLSTFPISTFQNSPYFLASNRFIEKKNLPRLIEAYAHYREICAIHHTPRASAAAPWDLVILGDGSLRADLCRLIADFRLQHCVRLPGFIQYPELPAYYAHAGAFIHASTTEQWGLVVNEAMASGLPVLVSNRCGCAPDLVQEGVNGFIFDPYNIEQLAGLMLKISAFNFPLSAFGSESQRIISAWGPDRFASGLKQAAECALRVGPVKPSFVQRMILKALLWK